MKKTVLLLMLVALMAAVLMAGCGPKKGPIVEPEQPKIEKPVDTTAVTPPPPPPVQKTVLQESQFKTVYFDFDKFNLRTDAREALDFNYNLLKESSDAIIKIEGHCDERGTVEYNLSLGEKRARSTQDYLVGLGIAPSRISIISYGKERPVDPGKDEAAWAKNRRCEFRIISQ
jgi:peptidoglycan-associated lipoprotein